MFDDTNIAINPLAVLKPEKEPRRYTLAEFLRREERSQDLNEYYDGLIIKKTMARGPHNIIGMNIGAALKVAVKSLDKKYIVSGLQQLVYLPELNFGLYPDVIVIAEKPEYWDNNQVLLTNPIVIIEVLSRSTKKYDRTEKFNEYKTIPSFQEYILIDQNKCHVESRFREEQNLWRDTIINDIEKSIQLKSINCCVELSDIYENIEFTKAKK